MRVGVLALAVVGLMTLMACAAPTAIIQDRSTQDRQDRQTQEQQAPSDELLDNETQDYEWVVVSFEETGERFDFNLMEVLLETETAADEALLGSDLGFLDGNDIGDHQYELYFAGSDREAMWKILEPVFERAPVPWTRVELRSELEDTSPRVITR